MHFHAWPFSFGSVSKSYRVVISTWKISPKCLILFQVLHSECLTFLEAHSFRLSGCCVHAVQVESELSGKCREVSTAASGTRHIYIHSPQTNIAPEIRLLEKKVVFEPTISRGQCGFQGGHAYCTWYISDVETGIRKQQWKKVSCSPFPVFAAEGQRVYHRSHHVHHPWWLPV